MKEVGGYGGLGVEVGLMEIGGFGGWGDGGWV